ncbi:MAG: sulfur carrier protein ThiS [Eubacterium sp.]|nr:sulfur carrier protein ThiS [Eubacterium sp.]
MVTINGEKRVDCEGLSVTEMLKREGYETSRIAIEINGVIISKKEFNETLLHSGDSIEVVSFVGGG